MITKGIIKLVPIKNVQNIEIPLEDYKVEQIKKVIYLEKDFSRFYSTLIPVVVIDLGNEIYRTYFGHEIVCTIKKMCPDFEKQTQLERKYMSVLAVKSIEDAKLVVSNFMDVAKNQLINFVIDDSFVLNFESKNTTKELVELPENTPEDAIQHEPIEERNGLPTKIECGEEKENSENQQNVDGHDVFYIIKGGGVRKIQKLNKTYLEILPTSISERIKNLKIKNVGKSNVNKIREIIVQELSKYGKVVETNDESLINQTIEKMKTYFTDEGKDVPQEITNTPEEIYIPKSLDYKEKQKINKQYIDVLPADLAKLVKYKKIKNVGKGVNLLYDEILNVLSNYFNVVQVSNDGNNEKIQQTINYLSQLKTNKVKLIPKENKNNMENMENINDTKNKLEFKILVPKGKKVFNMFAKNNPDFVRQTMNYLPKAHQKMIKSIYKSINWRMVKSESERIIEKIMEYLSNFAPVVVNEVEYVNGATWTEESIKLLQNIDNVFKNYHKDKSLLDLVEYYPESFWKKYAESTPEEIYEFLRQMKEKKGNVFMPNFFNLPLEFDQILEKTSEVDPQELDGLCDGAKYSYKLLKNYKLLQPVSKGGLKQFISNIEDFMSAYNHVAKFGLEKEFISVLEDCGFRELEVQMFYLKLVKNNNNNLPNTTNQNKIWESLKDKNLVLCK